MKLVFGSENTSKGIPRGNIVPIDTEYHIKIDKKKHQIRRRFLKFYFRDLEVVLEGLNTILSPIKCIL